MPEGHYLVLARKWRPQSFADVVGQEHVTRTLQNAIRAGRIHHAFLFIGSRGIGKTTTARILAKALNCSGSDSPTPEPCGTCDMCTSIAAGNNIDVIEIDGASNNSVEDVRQIRENVRMVPSRARYKIYVIDEVHQLSISAFNALLKTLEEPPAHAIFILATTEAHKIPATIVSRCQRYDFRRVGLDSIVALLRGILEKEGVRCSDEALHAIARAADGGVRDAESILDQLVSYCNGEITFRDVFDVLGLVDWKVLHDLCAAILDKDVSRLLTLVESVVVSGKDLSQFVGEILRYFRNLLVCRTGAPRELLALPEDEANELAAWAERFSLTELIRIVEQFSELSQAYDSQLAQRTALEALLVKMSRRTVEVSIDTVLEKLMALAEGVGVPAANAAARKPFPEIAPPPAAEEPPADKKKIDEPLPPQSPSPALVAPKRVDAIASVPRLVSAPAAAATPRRPEPGTAAPRAGGRGPRHGSRSAPIPAPAPAITVNKEDESAALEDPRVRSVVDAFKGRIVDIKRAAPPK